jgi:hypothetical protein
VLLTCLTTPSKHAFGKVLSKVAFSSKDKSTRALTFQNVSMCAQGQELERQAWGLVAAWNASVRGAQTPVQGAHLVSALVAMRQHVSKDTSADSPALAPRSSLKSYIGELQSAGGSLISVWGLGFRVSGLGTPGKRCPKENTYIVKRPTIFIVKKT